MMTPVEPTLLDRPLQGVVGAGTHDDPRLIVEIWLPVPCGEGHCLLMCHRIEARGGFWQGVSGRVESTDTTLREAAMRELEEELGFTGVEDLVDLGRWYDFESILSGRHYRKRSLAALLRPGTTPDTVLLSDEHDECRLMTFDEARASARFPEYVIELDGLEARLRAPGRV